MSLPIKSFETLVQEQVAAVQAAATALINFRVGTTNLAIIEANASMGVFLEFLVDATLAITRASTSSGADLDSWMADYDFFRLPAVNATGKADFSRAITTSTAAVVVGTEIKDSSLTQTYTVTKDETDPNYNPVTNSYDLGVGVAIISVPIEATVGGTAGNALSNTLTVLSSPIANIDSVNNSLPLVNGENQESDDDFRARFIFYINGLSRATKDAIEFAVEGVPDVVRFLLVENESFVGTTDLGFFYVLVDDGTGSPPGSLLTAVSVAVEDFRGFTIAFAVFAPVPLTVDISITLTIDSTQTEAEVTLSVTAALIEYVNTLPIQSNLPISRLFEIIYDSNSAITNATNLLVNGGTTDLPSVRNQIFIANTPIITYT